MSKLGQNSLRQFLKSYVKTNLLSRRITIKICIYSYKNSHIAFFS